MRYPYGEMTFAGVSATGDLAREVRREINKKYSVGPTYLHEWHDSLRNLPATVRVLCVGMDVGGFPKNLREDFDRRGLEFLGEVISVDFSPVRIQHLKHAFRDDTRFTFLLDDPTKLRFVDGYPVDGQPTVPAHSFDVVICTYALHDTDVRDPDRALKGLARSLKDDGFCLVATHARSSFPELLTLYRQACVAEKLRIRPSPDFKHFDNFAQEDALPRLEKWFGDVVFDSCDTSLLFERRQGNALEKFMEYVEYFPFPALGHNDINEEARAAVRARMKDMAAESLERDGYLQVSKPSGVYLSTLPRRVDKRG